MYYLLLSHNPWKVENGKKCRLDSFGTAQSISGCQRTSNPMLDRVKLQLSVMNENYCCCCRARVWLHTRLTLSTWRRTRETAHPTCIPPISSLSTISTSQSTWTFRPVSAGVVCASNVNCSSTLSVMLISVPICQFVINIDSYAMRQTLEHL